MSILPFEINLGIKAHFARGNINIPGAPDPDPGFFNGIFFLAAVIAGVCALADWALSKEQKRLIKEAVGDYWTALQYESLDALFRKAWGRAASQLLRLIGSHPWSLRRIMIPPVLHVALTYIAWWLLLSLLFSSKGANFGPIYRPGIQIYNVSTSAYVALPFFVWLFVVSWISWSGFAVILSRLKWSVSGTIKSLLLLLGIAVLVSAITLLTMLLYMHPKDLLSALDAEIPHFQYIHHPGSVTVQTPGTTHNLLAEDLVSMLINFAIDLRTLAIKIFWAAFKISAICLVVGPSIFVMVLYVLGVMIDVFLKIARPAIQPITSLVFARLYESNNGVFAQIGIFIGATLKLIDEGIKRLG